ncbi:RidA family protein [Pseudomonas corrugata]
MTVSNLPFSKVRHSQGLVFLSGELPFNEDGFPAGIEAQTRLTLMRIAQTLEAESLSLDDVVSVTVYLTERSNFAEFNRIYASFFTANLPVRATVCAGLVVDALVEISVIAQQRA